MKHKKRHIQPGHIAVEARVLDLVLTATYAAMESNENLARYVIMLLDAAQSAVANDDAASLRATVADTLAQFGLLRTQLDTFVPALRTHIAASRSQVARGSVKVM